MDEFEMYWKLEGQTPVACKDFDEWSFWYQHHDRCIDRDEVLGYLVSTVFLGINHNFFPESRPILFETMVFDKEESKDEFTRRYSTWEDARTGHQEVVEQLRRLTGA